MILDNTEIFSDQQIVTTTAPSTNVLDLGAAGTMYGGAAVVRDSGKVMDIPLFVVLTQGFAGGTSLQVSIEQATDAAFTTPVTLLSGPVVLTAALTVGKQLAVPSRIPEGATMQFIRLKYTVVGTFTTGKISAGIAAARQTNP